MDEIYSYISWTFTSVTNSTSTLKSWTLLTLPKNSALDNIAYPTRPFASSNTQSPSHVHYLDGLAMCRHTLAEEMGVVFCQVVSTILSSLHPHLVAQFPRRWLKKALKILKLVYKLLMFSSRSLKPFHIISIFSCNTLPWLLLIMIRRHLPTFRHGDKMSWYQSWRGIFSTWARYGGTYQVVVLYLPGSGFWGILIYV